MGAKAMKKTAMKSMKKAAMKAVMKVMKKPAMKAMKKTSKTAKKPKVASGVVAKFLVFSGLREKTVGDLKKSDLMKNKEGKIVSVKLHKAGKKSYARIRGWTV